MTAGAWAAVVLLAFGAGWWFWNDFILPRMIPDAEVEALADDLIAKHGPDAERIARANHYRAHDRDCDMVEARRWKLVRRRLDALRGAGREW